MKLHVFNPHASVTLNCVVYCVHPLTHIALIAHVVIVGFVVSILLIALQLLQLLLFHTKSVIVTLHVHQLLVTLHVHHAVLIHTHASVLHANVIVTDVVHAVVLCVHVPHTGCVRSIVTVTLALLHQFHNQSLYLTYIVLSPSFVLHPLLLPNVQLLLVLYASAVLHVLLSQLNCICVAVPLHHASVALNVNHTVNPLYAFFPFTVTPPFALIVPLGH